MTSHTWVFIIISYFCFRTLLLWRSRHIETREYPARCRLTSTSATARGRGASPSALPTFLQMVIIIHPPFLLPVTLQHSYALHKLHALRSLLQLCAFSHLDSHSSYFTSAVKVLREICSPFFFVNVFDVVSGSTWLKPLSECRRCEVCLFCSDSTFPSHEVHLLSDRASEHCWCRGVNLPATWLSHPAPHILFQHTYELTKKHPRTHTHTHSQPLLCHIIHVATWKPRNTSVCVCVCVYHKPQCLWMAFTLEFEECIVKS